MWQIIICCYYEEKDDLYLVYVMGDILGIVNFVFIEICVNGMLEVDQELGSCCKVLLIFVEKCVIGQVYLGFDVMVKLEMQFLLFIFLVEFVDDVVVKWNLEGWFDFELCCYDFLVGSMNFFYD